MSGGFNFGQSPGFNFGAQKTTAAAAPSTGFAVTNSAAPGGGFSFNNTTQANTNPTGTFSFGTPAKTSAGGAGFSFGTPTTTTFGLGTTPQTTAATGLTLGTAAAPAAGSGFTLGSLLSAQTSAPAPVGGGGFAFGAASQAQPTPAVAPAAAPTAAPAAPSTASGMSFGGGFSFGTNKVQVTSAAAPTVAPAGGFSFGTTAAPATAAPTTQSGGFNFGVKPSTTPAPPPASTQAASVSGPSLFAIPIVTTTAATATTGFTFGAAPSTAAATTAASGGLTFTLKPLGSTATSSAPASTAPAVAAVPAAAATAFTLGLKPTATVSSTTPATATTISTTAAPPVMTYAQLESLINKWSLELEDQERHFLQQATQVNAWDRMLVENGEKITSLHKELEKVKLDQRRLNQELDFILSQQKELEDLLCPLEESVKEQSGTIYMQNADEERERTYKLAENVDAQLKRMSQDLKEIIEHLNTSSGPADTSDPLQQICKILNAHMDSLQWIDQNSVLLQRRVEEVSKLCDTQRKEQEKTFRLTFD
ncbi:nucleoporin 62 like [Austrofundulus limnaeus]|uniref:Nuclear pore glycoprotein p62 n=1 Tax=Austrofundulus limnaeus TaxID=52670 RepID=A0A2I4AMV7_AUSLI|nr:PREDICTED: nuclear pore glycoprotein p62 [Austrofundulus limnaeus]